ncbi:hypothetical protein RSA31_22685 [Pantoea dispersa]|nr:hypothetical protein RSA31_22685 [Pantoea dispersa]
MQTMSRPSRRVAASSMQAGQGLTPTRSQAGLLRAPARSRSRRPATSIRDRRRRSKASGLSPPATSGSALVSSCRPVSARARSAPDRWTGPALPSFISIRAIWPVRGHSLTSTARWRRPTATSFMTGSRNVSAMAGPRRMRSVTSLHCRTRSSASSCARSTMPS